MRVTICLEDTIDDLLQSLGPPRMILDVRNCDRLTFSLSRISLI